MWRKPKWLTRCKSLLPWGKHSPSNPHSGDPILPRGEHSPSNPHGGDPIVPGGEHPPPRLHSGDRKLRKRVPARVRWEVARGRWGSRWWRRWRSLALRERPEPIPSFRGPVESPPPRSRERIGICCSGGGIRSAAFNLGALQVLQHKEELQRASYLAAVSGGSYIAAAFSMVATTREEGVDAKDSDDSDPELINEHEPPFAPGSPEEQYLRNRSSYLAPDGFGKLFIFYRVLLGFFFNVVFLATPVFAVMLILGWGVYRSVYPLLTGAYRHMATIKHHGNYVFYSYHIPRGCWIVPAAIALLSAGVGFWVLLVRVKGDRVRRGMQVLSTRLLILAVLVALFSIGLPMLLALVHNVSHALPGAGKAAAEKGVAGLLATGGGLAGLIAGILAYVRETLLTPKKALKAIEDGNRAIGSRVRMAVAYGAAALAGPVLVIGVLALGLSVSLSYESIPKWWVLPVPLALGAGMLIVWALFYCAADLTTWSLHPFYKRQLCTAFALKRVKAVDAYEIGCDEERELLKSAGGREFLDTPVAMERKFGALVSLSETALDGSKPAAKAAAASTSAPTRTWPSLIVCAAANVSDPGATPPGRPVTSFTFSARSVGGPLIGAMRTREFEEAFDGSDSKHRLRDLSLPSAVAMSGAAVAPSMGKMTRRPLTFLMALANIRLGVWVPNPRRVKGRAKPDESSNGRRYGRPRPSYLIRELLGRNRVDAKYLFVTDGGHYENLGLVELLRRGCTEIYCFDASDDNKFSVLGDAVALARSELGVEIEIDPSKLTPAGPQSTAAGGGGPSGGAPGGAAPDGRGPGSGAPANPVAAANGAGGASATTAEGIAEDNVAEGKIRYRDGREGVLIYARCVLTAKAPWDVMAHHNEDHSFPHNSTVDQLYTDQKFESYRALGEFVAGNAISRMLGERIKRLSASGLSASGQPRAGAPPTPAA
jgi:hypothetical protein